MKKTLYLYSGLICLMTAFEANAQLPANPWDTTDFDAAVTASNEVQATASATSSTVQETAAADIGHISSSEDRYVLPSVKLMK